MLQKIKNEIKEFTPWFKILIGVAFIVYLVSWAFTIYLSRVQVRENLEPVLPVATMDSTEYRNLSESMLSGNGFAQNGNVDTLIAPGYPFFISIFKYICGTFFLATLSQIILVFISAILIRRLGVHFYSKLTGEISAGLFLLNPVILVLALSIMTDILFLFLFLLGFYLTIFHSSKKIDIIFVSIIFASAIYVRPMGIFALPIFIMPILLKPDNWREKLKFVAIMIAVVLVAVSPWIVRNYGVSGVADFSSFRSANLALYAAPMFISSQNNTNLEFEKAKLAEEIGVPVSKWRDLRYSKEVSRGALAIILAQPFSYFRYHVVTSVSFLFSSSFQYLFDTYRQAMHLKIDLSPGAMSYLVSHDWRAFFDSIGAVWWKIVERVGWLILYAIASVGVWRNKNKRVTWVFIFVCVYLMLLAGPVGNARYSIQTLYFKLLLFGVGFDYLLNNLKMKYNKYV